MTESETARLAAIEQQAAGLAVQIEALCLQLAALRADASPESEMPEASEPESRRPAFINGDRG